MKPVREKSSLPVHVLQDKVVHRLLQAEEALAQAVQIDQVKLVMDVAAAQEIFAKRQTLGEDVIGYAHAIKVRALARLGELLQDLEKQAGARGRSGGGTRGSMKVPQVDAPPTLADLGITKKVSSVAQQLAALEPQTREAIAKREQTLSQARREKKAESVQHAVKLPSAKFRVLYADPPWSYHDKADAGSVQSGGAEMYYPSMSIADLSAMPVAELCESDAVLFLWVTSPLLFESAAVIKAWGFTYKASFVWDKIKHNMGHYNSVRHELLLVCTRGSCTPDVVKLYDSVQSIERTEHSVKPEEFRQIIDTLYPHGKRLELFGRKHVEGWTVYGNQLSGVA
jgi:N6-adenosine-specific RNA methylase IME4